MKTRFETGDVVTKHGCIPMRVLDPVKVGTQILVEALPPGRSKKPRWFEIESELKLKS